MMFDAAAVATAVEVADATDTAQADVAVAADAVEKPMIGAEPGAMSLVERIKISSPDVSWESLFKGVKDIVRVDGQIYVVTVTEDFVWDEASGTGGYVMNGKLHVLQPDGSGDLARVWSVGNDAIAALAGAEQIQASADGSMLFVTGSQGTALFGRDATTGALTSIGTLASNPEDGSYGTISQVVQHGQNRLYATSDDGSLLIFERNSDSSAWRVAHQYSDAGETGIQLDGANALIRSNDGNYLFVGTSGGNTLASVFRIGTDGQLTFVAAAQGLDHGADSQYFTSTLTLSPDGTRLYAFDSGNNVLRALSIDATSGTLTEVGVAEVASGQSGILELIASADGTALIAIRDNGVDLYAIGNDGIPAMKRTYSTLGEGLRSLRGATLSADGTQLYLAKGTESQEMLLLVQLQPEDIQYRENSAPVVLLPGGTLTVDDYENASVVFERTDAGKGEHDEFSFKAGDGWSLDQDGTVSLAGQRVASFTVLNGVLTLTFTADISRQDAQNALRRIEYRNGSNDPTKDGDTASFKITLNAGNQDPAELTLDVALQGVNNPPEVSTTPVLADFYAEGEPVKLFSNTQIDTIESGQTIWQIILQMDGLDANGVLTVEGGGKIPLDKTTSGAGRTATGQQYMVSFDRDNPSVVNVIVYVTGSTAAEAAQVVDGLAYSNNGDNTSGERTFTLRIKDNGGFETGADGKSLKNDEGEAVDKAVVTFRPAQTPNTPPILDNGADVDYREQADPILIAPGVTLTDAQMDRFNGDQGNYDGAVLTIRLTDGKSATDSLGFQAGNDLTVTGNTLFKAGKAIGTVTNQDGVLTIRFNDDAGVKPTSVDVQNTLRQITYANSSDVPVASVGVEIILADQRGKESDALTLSIQIEAVNDAPSIGDDPVLSVGDLEHLQTMDLSQYGLSTASASAASADGSRVYIADGQGRIALFSRDTSGMLVYQSSVEPSGEEAGIKQIVVTDGMLYVLRSNGDGIGLYAIDAEGRPSFQENIVSDYDIDNGALYDMKALAVSDDGRNLYLINRETIGIFSRDPATGQLTWVDTIGSNPNSPPYMWTPNEMVVQGERVYVLTATRNPTVIVYQRGSDGALELLTYFNSGSTDAAGNTVTLGNAQHIAVSADGRTIFVANSRTTTTEGGGWTGEPERTVVHNHPQKIDGFRLDPTAGTLVHLGAIEDTPTVEDIAFSADGKALLVTRNDGSLAYYSAANFEKLSSSQSSLSGANKLIVLSDGGVLVLADRVHALQVQPVPAPVFQVDGAPVRPFPAWVLTDPELDALGYEGAQITIESDVEGSRFGFVAGAGYTLDADGTRILADGLLIAEFVRASDGQTLVLSFAEGVTQAQANAVLRQVTYAWEGTTAPGKAVLTLTFQDQQQDSLTVTKTAEVVFNSPPQVSEAVQAELNAAGAVQRDAGNTLDWQGIFTDPDGNALTVTLDGQLPAGLVFDAANGGRLSGTLSTAGQTSFTLTATDEHGAAVSLTVTFNVANVPPTVDVVPLDPTYIENGAPLPVFGDVTLDVHGQQETVTEIVLRLDNVVDIGHETLVIDGTTIVLRAGASGLTAGGHAYAILQDGTSLRLTLTAAASGLPAAQAEGLLEGIRYASTSDNPSVGQPRVIALVSVRDSGSTAGGGSDTVQLSGVESSITLVAVNDAPQASGPLGGVQAEVQQGFSYTLPTNLFSDPEGDAFSLSVTGLPAGLTFDAATGTISGTPAATAIGSHTVVITATDIHGASSSVTLALQVNSLMDGATLSQLQPDNALSRDVSTSSGSLTSPYAGIWQTDTAQRHQILAEAWAGVPGIGGRPLGYSSLTMAGLSADPGLRGLPFYLTDTPRSEWERELEQRRIERPAATSLADHGGGTLHVTRETVRGTAQWDAIQGHYQYQLPDGLFSGRQADGSPLPEGIRLDARTGRIIATGSSGQWDLVLVAQTQDGRAVQVPVVLNVPESAADVAAAGRQEAVVALTEDLQPGAKVAVSDQIRMQAAPSLVQDAQRLLGLLGAAPQQEERPAGERAAA